MFNAFKMTYTVEGIAFDAETVERIRDQVFGYAYEDMHSKGVYPTDPEPRVTSRPKGGNVKFTYKWKVKKYEFV